MGWASGLRGQLLFLAGLFIDYAKSAALACEVSHFLLDEVHTL